MENSTAGSKKTSSLFMYKLIYAFACLLLFVNVVNGQTNYTIKAGNWNDGEVWSLGAPPKWGEAAVIDHSLALSGDYYTISSPVVYNINASITDPLGNATLAFNNHIELIINNATIGSKLEVSQGHLIVNGKVITNNGLRSHGESTIDIGNGDTLIINGELDIEFTGNSGLNIEEGGVLIINGNVKAWNNTSFEIDGEVSVNGNFEAGPEVSIEGNGIFNVSGTLTLQGDNTVFDDCTQAPCYGNPCAFTPGSIERVNDRVICDGGEVEILSKKGAKGPALTYTWQVSGDGTDFIDIPDTDTSQYSPVPDSSVYYRRKVVSAQCSTGAEKFTESVFVVHTDDNVWWGNEDSDWANSYNWCGGVPTLETNVTIGNTNNDPVISANTAVANLTIVDGASLTINGPQTLSVHGNFNNGNGGTFSGDESTIKFIGDNGIQYLYGVNTFKNLDVNNTELQILTGPGFVKGKLTLNNSSIVTNDNLEIDLTTGGMIVGPEIATGTDTIIGNVTVKRTITTPENNSIRYISTPLGDATIADFHDDQSYITGGYASYYSYDETVREADKHAGFKAFRNISGSIGGESLKGLGFYHGSTTVNFDITGTYSHHAAYIDVPLSHTRYTLSSDYNNETSLEHDGWNLIGNPYPSPLNMEVLIGQMENTNGAIYLYNNETGIYSVYAGSDGMVNLNSKYIQPMQGFFVKANGDSASITINHQSRSVNNGENILYRSAAPSMLKFTVSKGSLKDETIVRFKEDATYDHDSDFDAIKFLNGGKNPSIYTLINGNKYAINSLPLDVNEYVNIPLNVAFGEEGGYEMKVQGVESIDPMLSVFLVDNLTGDFYDLRSEPSFSFDVRASDSPDRFVLEFLMPQITSAKAADGGRQSVKLHKENGVVIAEFAQVGSGKAEVLVSDIMGRKVFSDSKANVGSGKYLIPLEKEGVYIFNIRIDNYTTHEKLYIPGN